MTPAKTAHFCLSIALAAAMVFAARGRARANRLEQYDLTGKGPSPNPGEVLIGVVNQVWSDVCIPVRYRINNTIDPIPDSRGGSPLPLSQAVDGLKQAMRLWSSLPASYIDLTLEGSVANAGFRQMDFVNEITFRVDPDSGYIASSRSYTFPVDVTLVGGEDIDGDGDSDVAATAAHCDDADGDGDFELPAGFYRAGTIFENDVDFNPNYRFVVEPMSLPDEDFQTVDLVGVAAHELGHALGLQHSMTTESRGGDGTGATMADGFYGGFGARFARRTLHPEDEAWASYLYPEGSKRAGPAALQPGDVAFDRLYALIAGEVEGPDGSPWVGASVWAEGTAGQVSSSAIAGHVQLSYDPEGDRVRWLPVERGVLDSAFEIPVARGAYTVGIEGVDFFPYPYAIPFPSGVSFSYYAGAMGITAAAGRRYGQQSFAEEYWSGAFESVRENSLGAAWPVLATGLHTGRSVDLRIEDDASADSLNEIDGSAFFFPSSLVAVRLPGEQIQSLDRGRGILVQAATFLVKNYAARRQPIFDFAAIASGRVLADGRAEIALDRPLLRRAPFVAQDEDDAPLYVHDAARLGKLVSERVASGDDIFLVLGIPEEPLVLDGVVQAVSPLLAYVDQIEEGESLASNAYISLDAGATFLWHGGLSADFELVIATR